MSQQRLHACHNAIHKHRQQYDGCRQVVLLSTSNQICTIACVLDVLAVYCRFAAWCFLGGFAQPKISMQGRTATVLLLRHNTLPYSTMQRQLCHTRHTMASETLLEPPGSPKAMLCMMESANSTGSWLTMDTCRACGSLSTNQFMQQHHIYYMRCSAELVKQTAQLVDAGTNCCCHSVLGNGC